MHKKSHQQQIFEVKRFPRDEHPYASSKVSIATRASPGSFKVSLKLPKSASCCKHTKSDTSQDYAHKSDKLSNGELENHEMTTEGDAVVPDEAQLVEDHSATHASAKCSIVAAQKQSPATSKSTPTIESKTEESSEAKVQKKPTHFESPNNQDSSEKSSEEVKPVVKHTTSKRNSLPYEMLITRLCDSLDMPQMCSNKKLPKPATLNLEMAKIPSQDNQ